MSDLISLLKGHFSKIPIEAVAPKPDIAKRVLGGERYRRVFEDRIKPVLLSLREKVPAGHIVIVGRRGMGKTHLCYRIIGEAESLGINYKYISIGQIGEKRLLSIAEELKNPSILIIDDIDERLYGEAATTGLRERIRGDISELIERGEGEPFTLVFSALDLNILRDLCTPLAWSKLVGTSGTPGEYARRAQIINIGELWDTLDVKERLETLIDILYNYIIHYVNNTPELSKHVDTITRDAVRNLFDDALWGFLARLSTISAALQVSRNMLVKLDSKGARVGLEDLGGGVAEVYKVLSDNVTSYSSLRTWRDRLKRIAVNIAELLIALGKAVNYAIDKQVPEGVKKGWIKVDVLLTMRDGLQMAMVIPTLEKSLYIRHKEVRDKIIKLLSFKNVKGVILLVPSDAEGSARKLVAGELGKAVAEERLIVVLVDSGRLFLLLSDLTLKNAERWRDKVEIIDMLIRELEEIKDIMYKPLTSKLKEL